MSKVKQLFHLPPFKKEEQQQKSRVLLGMILFYWSSGLIVLFMDQVWGDKSLTSYLILSCLLQIIPFILLIKGRLSIGSITTAVIYLGSITIFASKGLGIRDYVLMAYPAVILFAGITEKRRGLIISTLLTLACLAWLVLGERYG